MKKTLIAALVAAAFAAGQARGAAHPMILDKSLQFDPAVALTASTVSANTLDMLAQRDMAIGETFPMTVRVTVLTALTSAGATTLQIDVQGSVDNSTWTTYASSAAIGKASLTAGAKIDIPLPPQPPQAAGIPRYYRLNYTVAVSNFTGGTIEADLIVSGAQQNNPPTYPPGVTVSN